MQISENQIKALRECAEFLKDIVNASDGDEPYNKEEIFEIGLKLLNDLYKTGYLLGGEM